MVRDFQRAGRVRFRLTLVLGGLLLAGRLPARAQEPPPTPPATLPMLDPDLPAPEVPPAEVAGTPREAALEARIRQLEAMVESLSSRVQAVEAPAPPGEPPRTSNVGGIAGPGTAGSPGPGPNEPFGTVGSEELPPADEQAKINMPAPNPKLNLKGVFGNGFGLSTEDEEYQFQFHNLTQVDYRGYWDTPAQPLNNLYHSTFGLPRQWWIFSGRLTKPFEYFVVPAFGFDNVNLLDAFLNIHYDDRFQIKIGRYKTPYTYEFFSLPINGLISPERSIFFNNFGLNRDVGVMLWGQLAQKRIDYAAGAFNGSRNFYIDRNSSPDIVAFLNFRPFVNDEGSVLQFLNFGASVDAGNQMQTPVPNILRTNVATTGSSFYGVPFLAFNSDVIESGFRTLWDLHAAWYRGPLSLIGEWSFGQQDYARSSNPFNRVNLPVSGWYVQTGYFLTGETVAGRGMLKPKRDFSLKASNRGPGAIELTWRWSTVSLGQQVFTAGLADPNLWTNNAALMDLGVNWYPTQYIKMYFGWQHAMFANRVVIDPAQFQQTNDMLWARFQVYF
jgi:phosphate-selective porin OprO/OprP